MVELAYTPPRRVREITDAAVLEARVAAASGTPVYLSAAEVAEAICGYQPLTVHHLRVMAADDVYPAGSIPERMIGGTEGRDWARQVMLGEHNDQIAAVVAAATDTALSQSEEQKRMARLSDRLNLVNRRFRAKVEGVLSQAMRRAESHAKVKAGVRQARATKAKLAAVSDDLAAGRFTPEVLAALSTTDEELLAGLFDDAAAEVDDLFRERQSARRKAIVDAFGVLGVQVDELEAKWSAIEDQRSAAITGFVALAMFNEARSRLQSGTTGASLYENVQGEVPFDATVPGNIVTGVQKLADGAEVSSTGGIDNRSAVEHPNPLADYTDPLVTDLLGVLTSDEIGMVYTWEVGDPQRPFEPHQELAGETFDEFTYLDVCGKDPNDFPYGTVAYQPGDHTGCQCFISTTWVAVGPSADEEPAEPDQ